MSKKKGCISKKNEEKLKAYFNSIGINTDVHVKQNNKTTK